MTRRKRSQDGPGPKSVPRPKAEPAPPPPPVKELVDRLSQTWSARGEPAQDVAFDRVKAAVANYAWPEVLELLEKQNCLKRIIWREFTDTLEPHSRKAALARRRRSTLLVCQLLPVSARVRGTELWDLEEHGVTKASSIGGFLRAVQEELFAPGKPMEIDGVRALTVLFSYIEVDAVRQAIKPYVDCGLWRALPDAARLSYVEKDEFYASAWARVEGRERASPDPSDLIAGIVSHLLTFSLSETSEDADFGMISAILELMTLLLGQLATRRFVEPLLVASGAGAAVAAFAERLSLRGQEVAQHVAQFLAELRAPVDCVTAQELDLHERQRRHAADVVRLQQACFELAAPSLEKIAYATVGQIGSLDVFAAIIDGVVQAGELPLLLKAARLDSLNAWAAENDPQFSLPWPRIVAAHYQAPEPFQTPRGPLPDADALFSAPPVLPRSRKQFLTFEGWARHCCALAELETADELMRQLAEALLRLDIRTDGSAGGWARDAVLLTDNLAPVAESDAEMLLTDAAIDLTPFPEPVRAEWWAVKSQDRFCVITLAGRDAEAASTGQPPALATVDAAVKTPSALRDAYAIRAVHSAHVLGLVDEDGNVGDGRQFSALKRVLRLRISGSMPENPLHTVLLRLRPAVTEAVARTGAVQMLLDPAHRGRFQLPQWCQATMLGYGDRSGASMRALAPQRCFADCAHGLSIFDCCNASGKTVTAAKIAANLYHAPAEFAPRGPTALIASTEAYLGRVLARVFTLGVRPWHVARPGTSMQLHAALAERQRLLGLVAQIAAHLGVPETFAESATTACELFRSTVQSRWAEFEREAANVATFQAVWAAYPFPTLQEAVVGKVGQDESAAHALESAKQLYKSIAAVFADLETLQILEVLREPQDQAKGLLQRAAKLVVGRSAAEILAGGGAQPFSSIIVLGAAQLRMADVLPAIASASVERICLLGTDQMVRPAVLSRRLWRLGARDTLFGHLTQLRVPVKKAGVIRRFEAGPFWGVYATATRFVYDDADPTDFDEETVPPANAGFACVAQVVHVPGLGETRVAPGRVVRGVEADYVVGVFQYMRLIGYEADRIAIVCMTDAQADLVRDIIAARCGRDPQYGWPKAIVTPYTAAGVECEIVLISLVHTVRVPEALVDPRVILAAVSRASHGAYIFGELGLFSEDLTGYLDSIAPMDALYLRGRELADGSVRRHPRNNGMEKFSDGDWQMDEAPDPPVYRIESAEHMAAYVAQMAAERAAGRAVERAGERAV